jgi:hypothetical protein
MEFQNGLDIGWYDYFARQYDPALGRFTSVDLQECIAKLDLLLTDANKDTIRSMNEHDFAVSQHQFGLGLHILNYWGLWGKKELYYFFNSLVVPHPDNMSGLILVSYHRYLSQKDIDLNGQIRELNESIQEYENQEMERVTNSKNAWTVRLHQSPIAKSSSLKMPINYVAFKLNHPYDWNRRQIMGSSVDPVACMLVERKCVSGHR